MGVSSVFVQDMLLIIVFTKNFKQNFNILHSERIVILNCV